MNDPKSPPDRLPSHPMWHRSTFVMLGMVLALFVAVNLPGQLVLGPDLFSTGKYGPHFGLSEHCEHGWPFAYMKRDRVKLAAPPYWRLSQWRVFEGVDRFNVFTFIANVTVGFGASLAFGALFEMRRRRRTRFLQFCIHDMFVLVAIVSVCGGVYVYHRSQHQNEESILKAIERTESKNNGLAMAVSVRDEWQLGGPSWLRQFAGDRLFQVFDRVVGINTDGTELFHVVQLRNLKVVRIRKSASNDQLQMLVRIRHLEALDLCYVKLDHEGDDNGHVLEQYIRLPRMPHLRGLNLYGTAFRGDGLENIASIESLDLTETEMSDKAAKRLAELTNLKHLSLAETLVTDEALRCISSLPHLERLWLGSTAIGNGGIAHLSNLHQLRSLAFYHNDITDEAIPLLKQLTGLEYLELQGTAVSDKGIAELRLALPNCYIP